MRRTLILPSLLALLLFTGRAAAQCACTETDFDQARAESQAIFDGSVLELETAPDAVDWVWVTFRLEAHWKGELEETVSVLTAATEDDCGIPFRSGERWLVYARDMGGSLWANRCWRAHPYRTGDPDLRLLGSPIGPPGSWGKLKARYR